MKRPTLRLALAAGLLVTAALTVTGAALAGPEAPPPGTTAAEQQPAPAPNGDTRDCPEREATSGEADL